jgi:D-arabinose 1-dehydrogenase-like Zn-dependent alcohol dehydrogenase
MDRSAKTPSIPKVIVKHLRLHCVSLGSRSDTEELLALVESHRLSPILDARYSFDALPDALDRGPFGKLVVEIN